MYVYRVSCKVYLPVPTVGTGCIGRITPRAHHTTGGQLKVLGHLRRSGAPQPPKQGGIVARGAASLLVDVRVASMCTYWCRGMRNVLFQALRTSPCAPYVFGRLHEGLTHHRPRCRIFALLALSTRSRSSGLATDTLCRKPGRPAPDTERNQAGSYHDRSTAKRPRRRRRDAHHSNTGAAHTRAAPRAPPRRHKRHKSAEPRDRRCRPSANTT